MPQPSRRAQQVPLSPFRKLIPLADAAKSRGTHVYHLNIGQPDILTPERAIARLQAEPIEILAYTPAAGRPTYRRALADYYQRFNLDISPEQVLVTTGGSEAILFFFLSCFDAGDTVLIPEPFYANYQGFAQMAGVEVETIPCSIENGFALPPPEAFAQALTDRTKAIFITNPNNPTGCIYTEADLRALGAIAKEHDLFFCVDEVYREFTYGQTPFFSALHLSELEDQVLIIDSVSKRYSACGARVGAIVSRNTELLTLLERYAKLRLSPPGLGQLLAEYMLQDDTAYLDQAKAAYEARRNLVYRRLQKMPGVFSYLPGGAFYCFARFPVDSAERFCAWLLSDFDYQGATVMLSPGEAFYGSSGRGQTEARVAYVLCESDLEQAMNCLEAGLKAYPGLQPTHQRTEYATAKPR